LCEGKIQDQGCSSLREALGGGNPALWWMSTATAVLLALVLVWEPARGLFRFEPIHADGVLVILASTADLGEISPFEWRGCVVRNARLESEPHARGGPG
jgi:hypothetical protein